MPTEFLTSWVTTATATAVGVAVPMVINAHLARRREKLDLTPSERFILRGLYEDSNEGRAAVLRADDGEHSVEVHGPAGWAIPTHRQLLAGILRLRSFGLLMQDYADVCGEEYYQLTPRGAVVARRLKRRVGEATQRSRTSGLAKTP
jgi:hypothetical protein